MSKKSTGYHIPFYEEEKVALFIDGANLFSAARALEFDIDYRLLLSWAATRGRLVRAFFLGIR